MFENVFLAHQDFVFVRLKLFTWGSDGVLDPSIVRKQAGDRLADSIKSRLGNGKPIMVDCSGVLNIEDHAFDSVKACLSDASQAVVFFWFRDMGPILEADLKRELGKPYLAGDGDAYHSMVYGKKTLHLEDLKKHCPAAVELQRSEICRLVGDCYEPFSGGLKRLRSTPLLASGVFNARKLISIPRSFAIIALALADELEAVIDKIQPRDCTLLAVSLRASPFAAAAWKLLTGRPAKLEIVDHIGPVHEVLEEPSFSPDPLDGEYIFIGDFIIGSTELRVARAYARDRGRTIRHAVVIGSLLAEQDYKTGIGITPLVYLLEVQDCLEYRMF